MNANENINWFWQEIDLEFLKSLMESGVDINSRDTNGQTILHAIVRDWHPDVALFVIRYIVFLRTALFLQEITFRRMIDIRKNKNLRDNLKSSFSSPGTMQTLTFRTSSVARPSISRVPSTIVTWSGCWWETVRTWTWKHTNNSTHLFTMLPCTTHWMLSRSFSNGTVPLPGEITGTVHLCSWQQREAVRKRWSFYSI